MNRPKPSVGDTVYLKDKFRTRKPGQVYEIETVGRSYFTLKGFPRARFTNLGWRHDSAAAPLYELYASKEEYDRLTWRIEAWQAIKEHINRSAVVSDPELSDGDLQKIAEILGVEV